MSESYEVTGILKDDGTVVLDESIPLKPGPVQVVLKSIETKPRRPISEALAEIRASQEARGFVPPTREEVEEYLRAEKASWDRERDRD